MVNDVNPLRIGGVAFRQRPKLMDEQVAVLLRSLYVSHLAGAGIERAGEVSLLIFARCAHALLNAARHPVLIDLRVEVNVDFIRVKHHFVRWNGFEQTGDFSQSFLPFLLPRTKHDRLVGRFEQTSNLARTRLIVVVLTRTPVRSYNTAMISSRVQLGRANP